MLSAPLPPKKPTRNSDQAGRTSERPVDYERAPLSELTVCEYILTVSLRGVRPVFVQVSEIRGIPASAGAESLAENFFDLRKKTCLLF
jgi:hypothetical protein